MGKIRDCLAGVGKLRYCLVVYNLGKFRDCLAGVDNVRDCLVGENISKFWEILEIFRLEKLRKTLVIVWQEKIWGNFNIVW